MRFVHARAVGGADEVRLAAPAQHREGHPPDVARRRRVGRVEVAVGIEPGDRQASFGAGAPESGHRAGVGRAVAADDEQSRVVGSRSRRRRSPPPRGPARAAGTRRSGPGSSPAGRRPPRTRGRWPGRRHRGSRRVQAPVAHAARPPARARAARPACAPSPTGGRRATVGTPTMTMGRAMAGMVRHHGSMRIADFALERYFARWEFAVEHLLCASDVQAYPMAELLALADDETRALWDGLELGYTESTGHPLLRREIAALYETIDARRGPDLRRRRGGGLLPDERAVRAGRPRDRDLARLPEPVRGGAGGRRRRHAPRAPRDRRLGDRSRPAARQVTPATRLIVVNAAPQPDRDAGRPRDLRRRSSRSPPRPAPTSSSTRSTAASSSTRPIACRPAPMRSARASRSASCRRRTRWPACGSAGWRRHDRDLLARVAAFKDYTTICSSAPSEILAIIALRARDRVLARSRGDRRRQPRAARRVLRRLGRPLHLGPPAGRLDRLPAADRARASGSTTGRPSSSRPRASCSLPGSQFGYPGNHFRLGFGRTDLPEALARLEAFARRTLR